MKEMKKILAFFLCFVMVLGFVPVQAFAADTEALLDAAIFCSDVHGSTSDLTSVLGGVAKSGVTYSSIGFVGDTCLTVEKTESTVTSSLNYAPKVMFSYAASHDTEEGADIGDKWDYSGEVEGVSEHYLVYTIRETDMRYYADATTAAAEFVEWAKTADTSKPLFIMTHRPLHARRNDNAGASTWFNAIYEVAKSMDVVVLWAHNHTSESSVDIEHYYIAKGDQLYLNTSTTGTSVEMTDEEEIALSASAETYAAPGSNSGSATGEYVETNFTYMNAGYINANNQSPARIGVATTVQIYEDKMVFQDYNKSGAYTGTYAHNETVFFEHADLSEEEVVVVTPAQLVVTGTNEYTVGDTYEAPAVSVTYSDGSTKEVTDYEMTSEPELDMNTVGTYLLTFTYSETVNGQTYKAEAQFTVTVKEAATEAPTTEPTEAEKTASSVMLNDGTSGVYTVGDPKIIYQLGVYYTDGTFATVSQDECTVVSVENLETGAIVTEAEALATPGSYAATVSYQNITCNSKVIFTVNDDGVSNYDLLNLIINGATVTADVKNVTEDETVVSAMAAVDGISDFVAYDITATLAEGETATVSIPVPSGWAVGELKAYYVDADGNIVDENLVVTYADGYATFTVTHFSTYVVGVAGSDGTVTEVTYVLDILDENGTVIDWVTSLEQVTSSTTLDLGVLLTRDGETWTPEAVQYVSCATRTGGSFTPAKGTLYWTVNDDAIVTSIDASGLVTFSGAKDGLVNVSVYYCDPNSTKWMYDTITVTVTSKDFYTDTSDKTNFPEYPDEGSININKTATAVGNFSETGIAQVELYGNGVPVSSGGPIDIIVSLDWTDSMKATVKGSTDRYDAAVDALQAFLVAIMVDDDGTLNDNRVLIQVFRGTKVRHLKLNSSTATNAFEGITASMISSATGTTNAEKLAAFLETAITTSIVDSLINGSSNSISVTLDTGYSNSSSDTTGSTYYSYATKAMYDKFGNSAYQTEAAGRGRYNVFMTDGGPSAYYYAVDEDTIVKNTDGTISCTYYRYDHSEIGDWVSGSATNGYTADCMPELYTTKAKMELDVEVFAVGLGVNTVGNPYSGSQNGHNFSNAQYEALVTGLLNVIASENEKYETVYPVTDTGAGDGGLSEAFEKIATSIKQAATDVTIYDQITDEYELIFDFPSAMTEDGRENPIPGQEFYVEVVNYGLDSNYNRNGDDETLIRIYIDAGGAYYYKDPDDKTTKTYYTDYESKTNPTGVTVSFNNGEVASIVCKYFTYNAATKSFTWTTDKLGDKNQIALRYFVYLSNSLEYLYDKDDSTNVPAQPYDTNTIAWIEYKNHLDNLCRQEFPVPQLTWNGAQVTYYFYLVNEKGIPINSAGEVISFTNAVQVTDSYTHSVVWNTATGEGVSELFVEYLAADILPAYYVLYDPDASYTIHVYENETGTDLGNHFIIAGEKPINGDDDGVTTDTDYTTKVFMDKSSTKYDLPGTYTAANVFTGFDFADTTVAFAVMFAPSLQEDVVVVDFGLDVVVDVTANDKVDTIANEITLNGVSNAKTNLYDKVMENNGFRYGNSGFGNAAEEKNLSVTIESGENGTIRVKQTSMEFSEPVTFYYDTAVTVKDSNGYMYSSITVIPATTVYYEDSFLTLESYTDNVKDDPTKWAVEGTTINGTQDTDRPGDSKISFEIDADNVYGYDSAYTEMSEYSMGSAAMIHVDANSYGTASFSFYGTGFDVISETSNMTGTLIVSVKDANGNTVKNHIVDTYYGYMLDLDNYDKITYTYWGVDENGNEKWSVATEVVPASEVKENDPKPENPEVGVTTYTVYKQRWITTTNNPNAVHQVPVIKIFGLPYGQYTATITATYNSYFDHTGTENADGSKDGYDLYLDAIRIYDPAGTNEEANNAYIKDKEGYPVYKELRDMILSKDSFGINSNGEFTTTAGALGGVVFIDSNGATNVISDYTNYGPNNELYLAPGQAIAFNLNLTTDAMNALADVQIGLKLANGANAAYEVYNVLSGGAQYEPLSGVAKTATDMYYSIFDLRNGTIVIRNSGDAGILSVTNLKFTFKSEQTAEIAKEGADGEKYVVVTSGEAATNAVKSLSYVTPSTANFDPEAMDITFNRTKAEVGNNVIVTVTTSSDVKDLIVNGTVATNKTTSYLTGETTWSFTVPVEDNGSLKVTVVGYDAYGEYTVPYSETVTVVNMSGNQNDLLGKLFG